MEQKYGIIYIWYDKRRKMYYIGCHWGTEDDRYICSSDRMRKAFRRRPQDFKKRIIGRIYTSRNEMYEIEHKWLQLISEEELGEKYYNLRNHKWSNWMNNKTSSLTIKEKLSKISKGAKWYNNGNKEIKIIGDDIPEEFVAGRLPFSEEVKKNQSISKLGNTNKKGTIVSEKGRQNISKAKKENPSKSMLGKHHTKKTKELITQKVYQQILQGKNYFTRKDYCPYCGEYNNLANLKQNHYKNCKKYNETI